MVSSERRLVRFRELLDSEGDTARIARALTKGYISPEQLRECRAEIAEKNVGIVDFLLQKGYLTIEQFLELDASEPEPPASAERIGKYRLIRLVGRGGMGDVYEAEDEDLKRRVALKTTRGDSPDAEILQRMRREAAIEARLRHPNIVEIYDFGTVKDSRGRDLHYIAMEYVAGKTLAQVLAEGTHSRPAKLELLAKVAQAVGFAHSQGVLHRDLKPENVLIDEAGRVVLTDFGLAKSADLFQSRLTQSQTLLGTPQYMAPEQIAGKIYQISPRSDVYALGVMLYEVLAGRPPFGADTLAALYSKVLNEDPPALRTIDPTIERDLETICAMAMAKERRKRYADGNEFALELARFLKGEPISARPTGWPTRLWRRVKRRRALVLAVAGASFAVLLSAAWFVGSTLKKERGVRRKLEIASHSESEGRVAEARDLYRAVLEADSNRPEAKAGVDRTESVLREIAEDKEDAQQRFEAAQTRLEEARNTLYNKNTKPEEVLEDVQQGRTWVADGLEKAPGEARGHYLMGRLLEFDGSDEEAERSYREAIRLDPNFGVAHHYLGRLLATRALMVAMNTRREKHVDVSQDLILLNREALDEFTRARSLLAGWQEELEQDVAFMMTAYISRDLDSASRIADEALRRHGDKRGCEDFHWLVGYSAKTPQEALRHYQRALEIQPKHWKSLYSRAGVNWHLDRYSEALEDTSLLIQLRPRFTPAYASRAEIRLASGDLAGALEDAERVLAMDRLLPTQSVVRAYWIRGSVWGKQGDWKSAVEDFSKHLDLNPRCVVAIAERGTCLYNMGDLDGALRDAEEALRRQPVLDGWKVRGRVHCRRKEYALAVPDLTEAIRLGSQDLGVYLDRAVSYVRLQDFDAAIVDYERVLALAPPDWPLRRSVEVTLKCLRGLRK